MTTATFEVKHQVQEKCDLLILRGRVDANAAPNLELAILKIFDNRRYKIVLDLADVIFMSSSGLRVLISTSQQARKRWGGDVRLASADERIMDVMQLSGLTPLFEIFDTQQKAIDSFA